ncbi:hypothetical protein HHI36_001541 [Cryptolaemus montrouzieri]|uniref:Endonuclease/exonuclease/phosphatase domain-containing protein n=1 Tax=Cryptolaemus montrouzieri TaxID=559131 RepID=A0ABD2P7Y8_9CUCU
MLSDYHCVTSYNRTDHIHGGVAIFVSRSLQLEVKELHCNEMFSVPSSGTVADLLLKFYEVLDYCSGVSGRIFVCGDLNIDFLEDSLDKTLLLDLMHCYGLGISSNEPTRYSFVENKITASKIHYILTSFSTHEIEARVFGSNLGDHPAISLLFRIGYATSKDVQSTPNIVYRDFWNDNLAKLESYIEDT